MTKEEAIIRMQENFSSFHNDFIDGKLEFSDISEEEKEKLDLLTNLSYLFPYVSFSIFIKDILGYDGNVEDVIGGENIESYQEEINRFIGLFSRQTFFKERYVDKNEYDNKLNALEQEISELRCQIEVEEKNKIEKKGDKIEVKDSALKGTQTICANGVSFTMIAVEGGTFQMGATSEQGSDVYDKEKPVHSVTLSDYYIGETEVTQELWQAVMGSNPSHFSGCPQRPVEYVSWNDCQEFITKLNNLTGKNFRLPTEAEWEYAARGGNKSQGYKYSGSNTIRNVAWYDDNSISATHDVKTKQANELGIYDMSGNVWEWCQDWYGNYSSNSQTNPTGPTSGSYRVCRGGSWHGCAGGCRVSFRSDWDPADGCSNFGFRLVL